MTAPENSNRVLLAYVLRLADNALILSQRLVELVADGPELEEELANANFALDYLGQARMLYSYAGEIEGKGRTEDEFAFLRDEREFCHFQIVETPNGHFGDTLARSFLFDAFYLRQLEALEKCTDARLAEIAARAVREVRYHARHNRQWVIRLGDGTELSHDRMQQSLTDMWRYTGEFFAGDDVDALFASEFEGPVLEKIEPVWKDDIAKTVAAATLELPQDQWMVSGGREGVHSEHLGPLLAELQIMQRSYPGLNW